MGIQERWWREFYFDAGKDLEQMYYEQLTKVIFK